MSAGYRAVGWNRQKRIYDLVVGGGVALYLAVFLGAAAWLHPGATIETLLIRALGTAALLLLHVVLSIGPLCRLDPRFVPLLYNRRHLGVTTFLLGAAHGGFALFQFHALGDVNPLTSLLASNTRFDSLGQFPFQQLGFAALVVLFLMAATSHDFWLANLTAPVWKALHMAVYAAYGLLLAHVLLGVLQAETSPALAALLGLGCAWVVGLHVAAGFRERRGDRDAPGDAAGWVDVGPVAAILEGRARIVCAGGERIAVFRYSGLLSAVSNACQHQNGPLGEGKIVDGCITCPWHGYQYLPDSGSSPAPFTEKVPTFRVRIVDGRAQVDPRPLPPGTRVEPARIGEGTPTSAGAPDDPLYIGWLPAAPRPFTSRARGAVVVAMLVGVATALVLAKAQGPADPGEFEFGRLREWVGVIVEQPHPVLLVPRPGGRDEVAGFSPYTLVATGKHGAGLEVAGLDGRVVRLRGTLIHREGRTMVEVAPGGIARVGPVEARPILASSPPAAEDLGQVTLVGEIVDAKCFYGVMKPGRLKPHRDCAVRCISGGVPPLLLVRDAGGHEAQFLLVSPTGEPVNRRVLDLVAEPIEVTGRVTRFGDLLVLAADPATYRRL